MSRMRSARLGTTTPAMSPAVRVEGLEDIAISAGADRGGDKAERLGDQLGVREKVNTPEGN
jgi:hypothetical protein